jgi:hypothetical protein
MSRNNVPKYQRFAVGAHPALKSGAEEGSEDGSGYAQTISSPGWRPARPRR